MNTTRYWTSLSACVLLALSTTGCGDISSDTNDPEQNQVSDNVDDNDETDEFDGLWYQSPELRSVDFTTPIAVGAEVTIQVDPVDELTEVATGNSVFELQALDDDTFVLEAVDSGVETIHVEPAGDPVVPEGDKSFTLRAAEPDDAQLTAACGIADTLRGKSMWDDEFEPIVDREVAWLTDEVHEVDLEVYDTEDDPLAGSNFWPVTAEPDDLLEWGEQIPESGRQKRDAIAGPGTGELTLETTVGDDTESVEIRDDDPQMTILRIENPEETDLVDGEAETETYFPDEEHVVDLEDEDNYRFLPIRLAGDALVCEQGDWIGPEYRVESETPEVCTFGPDTILGGDDEESTAGAEEAELTFVGALYPQQAGDCTFDIEFLDGPLQGQTDTWTWTVEN